MAIKASNVAHSNTTVKALCMTILYSIVMFGEVQGYAQELLQGNAISEQKMDYPSDSAGSHHIDTLKSLEIQPEKEKYYFKSIEFENDYNTLFLLKNQFSTNHKKWSQELMKQFPVDKNGIIHIEYVIVCDKNFDKQKAMETSVSWFNYAFTDASVIKQCDYDNGIITASGKYINISTYNVNAIYYVKVVRINADTDITLRFKENRIKIDVMVRNYNIISGDSLLQSKNALVNISDAYPINDASDNKVAYARAFINCYANSFDKVSKYIDFMNTNMTSPFDTSNDDW